MRRWLRYLIPVGIVVVGFVVFITLVKTRPEATQAEPSERVPLVSTEAVQPVTQPVSVSVQGTVIPARQVQLTPQVSGKVVWVNPDFIPGGRVAEGEVLFRIEDEDYRLGLSQARANVERAEVELTMERGRKQVAEKEFRSYAESSTGAESNPLILREPQLKAAKASFEAARSGLDQAQLALERTRVKAPFNALVQAEQVEVGQTVGPQPVANLVGTDHFWVQAAISIDKLPWIRFPAGGEPGAEAVIRQDVGRKSLEWKGRVVRLIGDLEQGSRMARILISVEDPLSLRADGLSTGPRLPLLLGSFVNVEIKGPIVENVYRVPRKALRENEQLYVFTRDAKLEIVDTQVVWRTPEYVFVDAGVRPGDRLVTSTLSTPIEGMKLEAAGAGSPAQEATREPVQESAE